MVRFSLLSILLLLAACVPSQSESARRFDLIIQNQCTGPNQTVFFYINGEFIGGSDIMVELYQKGELQQMVEVALAS